MSAAGLPSPQNLVESFRAISTRLGVGPQSYEHLATLFLDLFDSPSPPGAMVNFVRFLETSGASGVFLNTMAGGKPLREILATVFGTSQYMSDIIIRNPGYLYWLVERPTWEREENVNTYVAELERDGEKLSFTAFIVAATARAAALHPLVHAYRDWRGRLVTHDHVDVRLRTELELFQVVRFHDRETVAQRTRRIGPHVREHCNPGIDPVHHA